MAIDRDEIARIAHLARLEIGEETAGRAARELSRILDFVGQMNDVDTAGGLRSHQNTQRTRKFARQHDLLLVTTRQ